MGLPLAGQRRRHLRLVEPCAPLAVTTGARIEVAPRQVLVGVLLGRPYVRTVSASDGDAPRIPALRAAMNLHLLAEDRLVVVDGDDRWLRDVMALHRAGGVEGWLVAVARRVGDAAPEALCARRERATTDRERAGHTDRRLHDLDALLGPAPEHGRPRLRAVPPPRH